MFHLARPSVDIDDYAVPFHTRTLGARVVKLVTDYLQHPLDFDRMAAEATDPKLKESLQTQAVAYRKLAEKRVVELKLRSCSQLDYGGVTLALPTGIEPVFQP